LLIPTDDLIILTISIETMGNSITTRDRFGVNGEMSEMNAEKSPGIGMPCKTLGNDCKKSDESWPAIAGKEIGEESGVINTTCYKPGAFFTIIKETYGKVSAS
jgi:hypothetical protein